MEQKGIEKNYMPEPHDPVATITTTTACHIPLYKTELYEMESIVNCLLVHLSASVCVCIWVCVLQTAASRRTFTPAGRTQTRVERSYSYDAKVREILLLLLLFINRITEWVGLVVTLLTHIWEMLCSKLGRNSSYLDWNFLWFSSILGYEIGTVYRVGHDRFFFSNPFQFINHPTIPPYML
jgi:hypothetical protein